MLKENTLRPYVLVTCDVEELNRRERSRGDRLIGLASGLKHVEDKIKDYDLVVDTTFYSPKEAAEIILKHLNSGESNHVVQY